MVTHNRQKTDVTKMQDLLKSEGLFPANIDSTGYYGNVTARAVLLYQKKYKVASDQELDSLAGKIVGPKTRVKLNS
jgi:peptidoglycan hydrolase-like protein with peptidoglycan-binding domain